MAKNVTTTLYEDFSLGIDHSCGPIARDARKFQTLENYLINTARQLERRPPCITLEGTIDSQCQGLAYLNGAFVTVAKAGTTVAHTITDPQITTVYFDNPEFCTDWTLVDLQVFNGSVVALIKHTFGALSAATRTLLHVWDDQRPTWVEDPAFPTTWTKSFPLHAYGEGTLGNYVDYTPKMAIVANKVLVSTPAGDVAFSATAKARVWNNRTPAQILQDGKWWYFITPDATGIQEITLSATYTDFTTAGTYAAYLLERCNSDGTWTQITEYAVDPVATGQYRITSTANRFDTSKPDELKLRFRTDIGGQLLRFRAMARPPVTVVSGAYFTPAGIIVGGTVTKEGSAADVASKTLAPAFPGGVIDTFQIAALHPGISAYPALGTSQAARGTTLTMPWNGQERYWRRIVATAPSLDGINWSFNFTGTVTTVVSQTTVVGVGTAFLTEAVVGQTIQVGAEVRTIRVVTDDTHLEVTVAWTTASAAVSAVRDVSYKYAYQLGDTGNAWYAAKEAEATLTLSGTGDAGSLSTSFYSKNGNLPACLAAGQNRLFVVYRSVTQMWQFDEDPVNNRLLSVQEYGAGTATAPKAVQVDAWTAIPTYNGPRLFSPTGYNKDYIDMLPIGDVFLADEIPQFTVAAWWTRTRTAVFALAGDPRLFVFTFHPAQKITAWSFWTISGLTGVDWMFTAGDYLYLLTGTTLRRFDADATSHRDTSDGATAYASTARWLFNDLGKPGRNKHVVRFEVVQTGAATVSFYVNPSETDDSVAGPAIEGLTQGSLKLPLAFVTPAIGVQVSSTDETGHTLHALGFDYRLTGR